MTTKCAFARQWLISRGNRSMEGQFDTLMTDPGARQKLFDQAESPSKPSLLSRLNPFGAARRYYSGTPEARQKFQELLKTRMRDPKFVARVFGGEADLGQSVATELPGVLSAHSFATSPKTWARAFGSSADPAVRARLHRLMTLYSAGMGKTAGWVDGVIARTSFNPADHTEPVNRLLSQHFPYRSVRDQLATDPNIGPLDSAKILTDLRKSNRNEPSGAVSMRDFLPAAIGGGLGYVGGSLLSSMLGLPQTQSRAFRWGAAALGSYLNHPKVGGR